MSDPSASDAFHHVIAPTADIIREVADAVLAVAPRHGHQPGASSPALAEIAAEEGRYKSRTAWDGPITDTHSFGGITLLAAADYAKAFAVLVDTRPASTFGYLAAARGALEVSVVSHWLNEFGPGVPPVERVKRGLSEHMYSAMELKRLRLPTDCPQPRVEYWRAVAEGFGWRVTERNQKPLVDGVGRPSVPDGINRLTLPEGTWNLGRVQWSYLSSVSHGTWYGLRESVVEPPREAGIGSPSLAGIGTTPSSVRAQAVCILRALRNAATARFRLMGWMDPEWEAICHRSEAHEGELIRTAMA